MDCLEHTNLPTGFVMSSIVLTTSISPFPGRSLDHALGALALVLRSSKSVHKSSPPMSVRFGRATPHPWFRFAIQLSGGDSRRLIYLVAVGEVNPGQSVPPEHTPPRLDEVQPRCSLRDERMLYSGMIFEPLFVQGALVGFQVVGDQVDDPFRDGTLYLL